MKDFKAGALLALVIVALTITAYLKTYNADYVPIEDIKADQVDEYEKELTVAHVYEDGRLEVMDEVDGDIKFYCEADFK